MRRVFLITAMLGIAPAAGAAELRDLRLWDGPDSTRIVFDLNGAPEHKVFTLSNPDRVVVDIAGAGQKAAAALVNRVGGKGLVQKLRSAPKEDGSLRVVLEVAHEVDPKAFDIQPNSGYGYRLVLDLYDKATASSVTDAVPASGATAPAATPPAVPVVTVAATPPAAPPPAVASSSLPKIAPPAAKAAPPPAGPAVRLADKPIVVAVDAGHGGEDPGARGNSGLLEKDVALAIAKRLAGKINEQPGMRAVLTRDGDYYVGLRERVQKARKAQADLFVSIHCNALTRREMHGTAVYVLSTRGATNEHARWLANQENAADMVGGIDIQDKDHELAAVLIDLSQSATMEASFDLGNRMLDSLGRVNTLQKPHVQQAGFVVLKAPDIPSVLVETAFITNPREERMLADDGYQDKMATSMLTGIKGYFQNYRPQQQVVDNNGGDRSDDPARAVQVSLERKRGGAKDPTAGLAR
ncbi:MAG: N-acetylmuramoyl-L-alanine amidase [Nevskiaceae bacterium]|nr:MAG: N-acetylmuramoyl-L-alanine amidase [Nevskiaceae bacterium]